MREAHGYFRDNNGDKSMARVLAFMMQAGGAVVIVVGLALIVVAFFSKRADAIGAFIGLVGIGAGMDAAGPAVKNWSKGAEARVEAARNSHEPT